MKVQRKAYSGPDGVGMYQVRLVMRYEDGREREDAKNTGFRWDALLKEWYKSGLSLQEANDIAEGWAKRLADLGNTYHTPPDAWKHRRPEKPDSATAQEAETLRANIQDLRDSLRSAETARETLQGRVTELENKLRLARAAGVSGLYKAKCPGCGEDTFFEIRKAERI